MTKRYQLTADILDPDFDVYVERSEAQDAISKVVGCTAGAIFTLKAHRQTGKTTLLNRIEDAARAKGWEVWRADLRTIFSDDDPRQSLPERRLAFVRAFLETLLRQAVKADSEEGLQTPASILLQGLSSVLGADVPQLILVDEFDVVGEAAAIVNLLFEAARNTAKQPGKTIVWVFAGTQSVAEHAGREGGEPSRWVFQSLELRDFPQSNELVIQALAEGLSFKSPEPKTIVERVLKETGGQPYLTCKCLDIIESSYKARQPVDVESTLYSAEILNNSHFAYVRQQLDLDPVAAVQALYAYQRLLSGEDAATIPDLSSDPRRERVRGILVQSGLVRETGLGGGLVLRSPLYARKFTASWAQAQINELRSARQKGSLAASLIKSPESRPRIGVINLGGTMGMEPDLQDVFSGSHQATLWVLDEPGFLERAAFVELASGHTPTDGVNIGPADWQRVSEAILQAYPVNPSTPGPEDLAGVIVIAGTDTLAYAASAIAIALGPRLPFPIIFTGSQTPRRVLHGDAYANLFRSIEVIRALGRELREVLVLFGDEVFRAVRVDKLNDFRFNGFHSPTYPALAICAEAPRLTQAGKRLAALGKDDTGKVHAGFSDKVLRLSLFPGLRTEAAQAMVELLYGKALLSGVVLETLGIGNVPSRDQYELASVVKWCINHAIPVLIAARYPIDPEFVWQYAAAAEPLKLGALYAGNMSPAAALTKFMWSISVVDTEAQAPDGARFRDQAPRLERIKYWFREVRVGERDDDRDPSLTRND